jgi:hypothetical protein
MRQPNSGLDLVNVLSALAARPHGFPFQIVLGNLELCDVRLGEDRNRDG